MTEHIVEIRQPKITSLPYADETVMAASMDKEEPKQVVYACDPDEWERVLRAEAKIPCEDPFEDIDVNRSAEILRAEVAIVLDSLTERERLVLRARLGLTTGESQTQKEVGLEIGYSRTTVSRIERAAWAKLRHSPLEP